MKEFELEETPEITIADNPIGKLLLLIAVVLSVICLTYFCTELRRPAPIPEKAPEAAISVTVQ